MSYGVGGLSSESAGGAGARPAPELRAILSSTSTAAVSSPLQQILQVLSPAQQQTLQRNLSQSASQSG